MRLITKSLLVAFVLTCSLSAFSQDVETNTALEQNATPGLEHLTLQRCRDMALEYNQNMKMANKTIDRAHAEQKAVRALFLPKISGSGLYMMSNTKFEKDFIIPVFKTNPVTGQLEPILVTPENTVVPTMSMWAYMPLELSMNGAYMAGLDLEQPVFVGGKILTANKMANIGVEMASQNLELQRYNTIAEADQAYWLFVSVSEKVRLAQTAVNLLDTIIIQVKNGVETGMLHENELLKVKVKHNEAALGLQKARSGLELTRMSLCRVIGLPLESQLVADDSIVIETDLPLSAEADVSLRPDYKLLHNQLRMKEQEIKLKRADYLPLVGIKAGYSYMGGIELTGEPIELNGFNVIGSIKIPIFSWLEGHNKIKAAKIEKDIAEIELNKNSQLMQMEIEQTRLNMQDALLRIKMSEDALKLAEENLRVSRNNYELGSEVMINLLTAQTQWQQASSELIEAKADYKLKQTLYLKATGRL